MTPLWYVGKTKVKKTIDDFSFLWWNHLFYVAARQGNSHLFNKPYSPVPLSLPINSAQKAMSQRPFTAFPECFSTQKTHTNSPSKKKKLNFPFESTFLVKTHSIHLTYKENDPHHTPDLNWPSVLALSLSPCLLRLATNKYSHQRGYTREGGMVASKYNEK